MSVPTCGTCQTPNAADARFCEGCGTALERRCPGCGTVARSTARFCRSCGSALDSPAGPVPATPTRKTVTVLFADLAGSTAFEETIDAETAREVIGEYHELLRSTATRHHAGALKFIGDGFMAVWGTPEIGPDDADHAVAAAVDLQQRFVDLATRIGATHGNPLALRVSVNTGEVVVGAGDADLVGDALNVAARLESVCPHGQVVVGEETWRATRGHHRYEPLGRVQVKGRAAAVPAHLWVGRRTESAESVGFVGRGEEFRRLGAALDQAVDGRAARLVTIIGDPGVGKTRLAAEFAAQRGVRVIDIRCAAEGSVALAPLIDMIRTRTLDIDVPAATPERDRILRGLSDIDTGAAASVEETFWALRRFIEVLSGGAPLIVVADDIQWADAQLLDFIEHLIEWVRTDPVLVIALSRPEIRQHRADFAVVGDWVADAIRLSGLDPDATIQLASQILGGQRLPEELMARLPGSTGGNPLFVRELVAMLVHDGVLVADPAGWRLTIDADAIAVPPTIQALLASRLDRMNSADRRVLELASVIGTDFSPGALAALGGVDVAAARSALDRLRRVELAQPSGGYLGDEPIWRFHHVLIRDVAYRRLLKSDRAELHKRFADWVDGGGSSGAVDPEQLSARHVEAAYGYRCDLGLRDKVTAALAVRSARGYLAAARRALDRDAMASAGAQAARGSNLAAAEPALHAELLNVACEAYLSAGDVAAGAPFVEQLEAAAGPEMAAELAPWAACYRCQLLVHTAPSQLREVDERLGAVVAEFARRGNATGTAKAYRVRAAARARMGRVGDAELDLFEALVAARRAGDHRQITAVLGAAPNAALWGPSPVPKAGGRCLDVVRMQRMTTGAPSLEATSLRCLAVLEVLRGRPEKARSMLDDARVIVADLGLRLGLMETELFAGIVELMAGDAVAAEPHFRIALDGLDVLGVGADAGQAAALLARSLLAQGKVEEADRYAAESERMAGHNLKTAIAWRAVRAEILCSLGRHDDAVALAREAVAVAAGTDLILDHAEACLALSRVLAAAGDPASAAARLQAESLYTAKDAAFPMGSVASHPPASGTLWPAAATSTRLALSNRATEVVAAVGRALQGAVSEALFAIDADAFVYEDRRTIKGAPIAGSEAFVAAARRKFEQYQHFQSETLAVRGKSLALTSLRWWDDTGNETVSLDVIELAADTVMRYHGRFDEDDFAGAYAELERRYYAGEGARFAVNGATGILFLRAMSARDVETARRLAHPDFRWTADPAALKPAERTVDEFFAWLAERDRQVSALRFWIPSAQWISPDCVVALGQIQATGTDGQDYRWEHIFVDEYRDGLVFSNREFAVDQEDTAFAYAKSLARRVRDPLALENRCTASATRLRDVLAQCDTDAALRFYAAHFVYDDHRMFSGDAVCDRAGMVAAIDRLLRHYGRFGGEILAVRGDRIALGRYVMADDAGNETTGLLLREIDAEGLIIYECRFDEVDFSTAYQEMDRRYYAGEGAPFAGNGQVSARISQALNLGDMETVRALCTPDYHWQAPASALKPAERSLDEMVDWGRERSRLVETQRSWIAAVRWFSADRVVGVVRIEATGADDESFHWTVPFVSEFRGGLLASSTEFDTAEAAFGYAESLTRPGRLSPHNQATETTQPYVAEFRDSRPASMRQFEAEDEDGAPAYAESRTDGDRLEVRNAAGIAATRFARALQDHDVGAAANLFSETCVFGDRRAISGDPIEGKASLRSAIDRIMLQFSHFEADIVAIRGDRLALSHVRWSDGDGNTTSYYDVVEVDGCATTVSNVRFDGDDLDSAYRELEGRYFAGEGRPFAANETVISSFMQALDRLDVEAARTLSTPDFVWCCPPTTLAAERRTLEEFFAWQGERARQVTSIKNLGSVIRWVSPDCVVARGEVHAVSLAGEHYTWSRPYVGEFRGGLLASVRQFNADDDAGAIGYAEGKVRSAERLEVRNAASESALEFTRAVQRGDIDAACTHFSETCVLVDQRSISGEPIRGRAGIRAAIVRVLQQLPHYETAIVAVRGDRLALTRSRWFDDAGNESAHYSVAEVDSEGRNVCNVRFDAGDFEAAYRELERRYYDGEGAAHAESAFLATEYALAINRGDFDMAFGELSAPDLHIENYTRSVLPYQSAVDLRESLVELRSMLASVQWWFSAVQWISPDVIISRLERRGTGHGGENYSWTRIVVTRIRDGRTAAIYDYDAEDHQAAFARAKTLVG